MERNWVTKRRIGIMCDLKVAKGALDINPKKVKDGASVKAIAEEVDKLKHKSELGWNLK